MGVDISNPRWWLQLPQEAFVHLTFLLDLVEQTLRWPDKMLVNIAQLMFKSDQADRPIALTQGARRAWARVRRHQ
eukprot:1764530-Pyramimonas_sp.AAC.1